VIQTPITRHSWNITRQQVFNNYQRGFHVRSHVLDIPNCFSMKDLMVIAFVRQTVVQVSLCAWDKRWLSTAAQRHGTHLSPRHDRDEPTARFSARKRWMLSGSHQKLLKSCACYPITISGLCVHLGSVTHVMSTQSTASRRRHGVTTYFGAGGAA
jgi:hypothetical protein